MENNDENPVSTGTFCPYCGELVKVGTFYGPKDRGARTVFESAIRRHVAERQAAGDVRHGRAQPAGG